jgi:hypothetical protein
MTEKTDPSFEEAVAADWKNAYATDIERMSPVQKHALQAAWREVESSKPDSERDFASKVSRMGRGEYDEYVSNAIYDAERAKAGK